MESRAIPETAERAIHKAELWRELLGAFQTLVGEQVALIRTKQQDRRLRGCWSYGLEPTRVVTEGWLVCWLYSPQSGKWKLGEGPNENLKGRFEALATRAAIELQPPGDIAPLDFWLHRLYLHLQETKSRGFLRADTGIFIEDVCQDSATFCARLEREALEASLPTPQRELSLGRLKATIYSPSAARKMDAFLQCKGIGQTDFAATVGTTDRTLRSFRKTGKVRRDILESIAKHMGTTKEAILKE